MALPLPSPIRDYAAVTWDTQRIAEVITELNALGASIGSGLDSKYARNPGVGFLDVTNGDGSFNIKTIFSGTFNNVIPFGGANIDTAGGWSDSNDWYVLPASGTYYCTARIRILDTYTTAAGIGIGINNANVDGAFFQWYAKQAGIARWSVFYERIGVFTSGDALRVYCYQDSDGAGIPISRAHMQIWRLS